MPGSHPWHFPVTILGQTTTGNGVWKDSHGAWHDSTMAARRVEPDEPAVVVAPSWHNGTAAGLTGVTGTLSGFTGAAGGTYTIYAAAAAYATSPTAPPRAPATASA